MRRAVVDGGRPVQLDRRVRRHVEAIRAAAVERFPCLVNDGHQVILAGSEMLGAEVRHGIGNASAVHWVGVRIGEVRHHPFIHTRRGRQCPVGAFVERRRENTLVLEIEPGMRFARGVVKNLLYPGVGVELFAFFDADGLE